MESFDEFAIDYDKLLSDPLRQKFAGNSDFFIDQKCRVLMRHLPPATTAGRRLRLLDAGCGQGRAIAFLRRAANVVGTDVSFGMVREAVRRGPVAVQEPFSLPFADDTFDAVYAFCVYHHIDDSNRERHLRELARVVVPGGQIYVFEHNPFNPVTKRVFERAPVDRGWKMIRPSQLRSLFGAVGLDDIEQGYFLFLPERVWKWLGFIEPALSWLPLGGQYFMSGRKPGARA